jgi:hypothetical protein
MNVLIGRENRTSGDVAYTDDFSNSTTTKTKKKLSSALLDRIIAFVPQNDVYLREIKILNNLGG